MARMHEAQLYWDDQNRERPGWYLRYCDDRGNEHGIEIDAAQDATTEELATAVEMAAHWLPDNGQIVVIRNEWRRGSITLADSVVTDWRATR